MSKKKLIVVNSEHVFYIPKGKVKAQLYYNGYIFRFNSVHPNYDNVNSLRFVCRSGKSKKKGCNCGINYSIETGVCRVYGSHVGSCSRDNGEGKKNIREVDQDTVNFWKKSTKNSKSTKTTSKKTIPKKSKNNTQSLGRYSAPQYDISQGPQGDNMIFRFPNRMDHMNRKGLFLPPPPFTPPSNVRSQNTPTHRIFPPVPRIPHGPPRINRTNRKPAPVQNYQVYMNNNNMITPQQPTFTSSLPNHTGKKKKRRDENNSEISSIVDIVGQLPNIGNVGEILSFIPFRGPSLGSQQVEIFFKVSTNSAVDRFLNNSKDHDLGCFFGEIRTWVKSRVEKYDQYYRYGHVNVTNDCHFVINVSTPQGRPGSKVDVKLVLGNENFLSRNGRKYEYENDGNRLDEDILGLDFPGDDDDPNEDDNSGNEDDDDFGGEGGDSERSFAADDDDSGLGFDQNPNEDFDDGGFDFFMLDSFGGSRLHYAAAQNRMDLVVYFIESLKFPVNMKDMLGITPLYLAKHFKRKEIIDYLEHKVLEEESNKVDPEEVETKGDEEKEEEEEIKEIKEEKKEKASLSKMNYIKFMCARACEKPITIDMDGKVGHICGSGSRPIKHEGKKIEEYKFYCDECEEKLVYEDGILRKSFKFNCEKCNKLISPKLAKFERSYKVYLL